MSIIHNVSRNMQNNKSELLFFIALDTTAENILQFLAQSKAVTIR